MEEVTQPPEGASIIVHLGESCLEYEVGRKLPTDAVAWSWSGSLVWHSPNQWPWGVYAVGECEAEMQALAAESRKKAQQNRFDESGKVDVLVPVTRRERPAVKSPQLPPGFILEE